MSGKKPLYERIVEDIKSKILEGEYQTDTKIPTELELADMYKVSRITSKRALEELKALGLIYRVRGSGSFVSPEIIHTSDNLNTSMSRGIVKDGTKPMIALIMPLHVTESSFAKSINGAIEVLDRSGFYSIVNSGLKSSEDERKIITRLYQEGVQGIIYYPVSDRDNYKLLNMLVLNEYPIVTIDKYFEGVPISSVIADNYSGCYKVTKHLIDFGHEKIGFVSDLSIESTTSVRDRYFGYTKALRDAGFMNINDYTQNGFTDEYHREYKSSKYKSIIKHFVEKGVTAIVGVNDQVATFLLRAAIEMNINVPDQLSITGFDDLEMTKYLQVPLTTLHQDFHEIGKRAAEFLVEIMEKGSYEYKQIKLPVSLIERKSSAKRPS